LLNTTQCCLPQFEKISQWRLTPALVQWKGEGERKEHARLGWVFATAKSIFARTVEKTGKNHRKTAKTGNKFSTLNWIEILWCNYIASLNH